jgi:vacuolar protein 8
LSRRKQSSFALLPSDRQTTNFFTGAPLASLTTLSFSDNVDLQRSAALAFAEITEKEVREVGRDTLDPILFLLGSHDTEVQRAASAALGNLAVNRESGRNHSVFALAQ